MKKWEIIIGIVLIGLSSLFSQDKNAYNTTEGESNGLLDPSRLKINHSLTFGAISGGNISGLQSQSLYTTMLRYQFAAPVTLNLNFSLPIHSTFSHTQNFTSNNLQSLEYFKSIPFEVGLSWQPTKNTLIEFNIIKYPQNSFLSPYNSYYNGLFWR